MKTPLDPVIGEAVEGAIDNPDQRIQQDIDIFTAGNARPLDQALQHATTEMTRWLGTDYGLDVRAASTLMGQTVEYEIGNVYDPAYTVMCKMPKAILASLAG